MARTKKQSIEQSVAKPVIEVGKSSENSVERKFPQIHESRKDINFNRPDPLKVDLKDGLKAKWVRDNKDNVYRKKAQGYVPAVLTDFKDTTQAVLRYGDLVLFKTSAEVVEQRKQRQSELQRNQSQSLVAQAKREGIATDERDKRKGYVSGFNPDTDR